MGRVKLAQYLLPALSRDHHPVFLHQQRLLAAWPWLEADYVPAVFILHSGISSREVVQFTSRSPILHFGHYLLVGFVPGGRHNHITVYWVFQNFFLAAVGKMAPLYGFLIYGFERIIIFTSFFGFQERLALQTVSGFMSFNWCEQNLEPIVQNLRSEFHHAFQNIFQGALKQYDEGLVVHLQLDVFTTSQIMIAVI
jgi:hypothetical protein